VYYFWPTTTNAPAPGDKNFPANPHGGIPWAVLAASTAGGGIWLFRARMACAAPLITNIGIGTQAVMPAGLPAGGYPAILIKGTVYIARFHFEATKLAGGAAMLPVIEKEGYVLIDSTGKVLQWLYQ